MTMMKINANEKKPSRLPNSGNLRGVKVEQNPQLNKTRVELEGVKK
jgi:hypothetical protein